MKYTIAIIASLFMGPIFLVPQARAVTFDRGEHVRIDFQGQNETRLITGNTVELTGEIDGDVYVFAESLISKAVINGDLIGAVGSGLISGTISGNIRMAASSLTINAKGNNATIAGGTIILGQESSFKDAFIASQRATFQGQARNLHAVGSNITLSGTVNERASFKGDNVIIAPTASINGNLVITSKHKPEQFDTITVAGTRKFIPTTNQRRIDPMRLLLSLFWILAVSYVLRSIPAVKSSLASFIPSARSLLLPVLALVFIPVATILLVFTLIGLPLAAILTLLAIIGFILSKPLFVILAAELISQRNAWNIHLSLLLTSIAVLVLTHIPFIAPLFQILIFLSGWAIAVRVFRELLKSKNTAS